MGACMSKADNSKNKKSNTKNGRNKRQKRPVRDTSSSSDHTSDSDDDSKNSKIDPQSPGPLQITTVAKERPVVNPPISQDDQDILFYKAFVCNEFSTTPVSHETLRNAMKLAMLAPSAYNCSPMRVVFVKDEGRDKVLSCVKDEDKLTVEKGPVIAIICTDKLYTRKLPTLMPYVPNAQQMFEQYEDLNEMIRIRNSNLQAGYLILALRSLGLAVGPIINPINDVCDEAFLAGTSWCSNLIITFGYPSNPAQQLAQQKQTYALPFDFAAKIT